MAVDFDKLNRETREFKNTNVSRPIFRENSSYYGCDWINRKNNETFKENNNCYSNYYSNHK